MYYSVATFALVSSRLDFANSELVGGSQKHIARLQRAQHAFAYRVVTQQFTCFFLLTSTDLLAQLHWLSIK